MRAEHVVLQFLVLQLISSNVNAERPQDNVLGFLSRLLGKRMQNPIIAVFNQDSSLQTSLRTSDTQNQVDSAKTALRYLSDIIQTTGDENNPNVQRTNQKYINALRTRCELYIECEIKCKKKKKDCKKSCQDTYDNLDVCKTTKDKWLTKTNKQVYEYLKKNPPQYNKRNKKYICNTSTKGPKRGDSDECNQSNDCSYIECEIQTKNDCESSDSCN